MPNWTTNKIKIKKELLDPYMDYGNLDFNLIKPIPEDQENNSYFWCIENWGTKWNAGDCWDTVNKKGILTLEFDTAWAPPVPIFEKLCELYPDKEIEFRWKNEGERKRYKAKNDNGVFVEIGGKE